MVGIGGIAGLLFGLSQRAYFNIMWFLLAAIIVAGVVAWARLALKAHEPAQVYTGFSLGWICVTLCIILI